MGYSVGKWGTQGAHGIPTQTYMAASGQRTLPGHAGCQQNRWNLKALPREPSEGTQHTELRSEAPCKMLRIRHSFGRRKCNAAMLAI